MAEEHIRNSIIDKIGGLEVQNVVVRRNNILIEFDDEAGTFIDIALDWKADMIVKVGRMIGEAFDLSNV